MAVDPVTTAASNPWANAAATTKDADKAGLNYDSFLKLLIAQMKNQDPTDPMDASEQMSQLASFSQVEQTIQTNAHLRSMLQAEALTRAGDLFELLSCASRDCLLDAPRELLDVGLSCARRGTAVRFDRRVENVLDLVRRQLVDEPAARRDLRDHAAEREGDLELRQRLERARHDERRRLGVLDDHPLIGRVVHVEVVVLDPERARYGPRSRAGDDRCADRACRAR